MDRARIQSLVRKKDMEYISKLRNGKEGSDWVSKNYLKLNKRVSRREIRQTASFKCPILGIDLEYWGKGPKLAKLVTIDKELGFIPGNIMAVSTASQEATHDG